MMVHYMAVVVRVVVFVYLIASDYVSFCSFSYMDG